MYWDHWLHIQMLFPRDIYNHAGNEGQSVPYMSYVQFTSSLSTSGKSPPPLLYSLTQACGLLRPLFLAFKMQFRFANLSRTSLHLLWLINMESSLKIGNFIWFMHPPNCTLTTLCLSWSESIAACWRAIKRDWCRSTWMELRDEGKSEWGWQGWNERIVSERKESQKRTTQWHVPNLPYWNSSILPHLIWSYIW